MVQLAIRIGAFPSFLREIGVTVMLLNYKFRVATLLKSAFKTSVGNRSYCISTKLEHVPHWPVRAIATDVGPIMDGFGRQLAIRSFGLGQNI